MKIALIPVEQWEQLNEQLKETFSLPADNSVRAYKGLAQAAYEIVQGLAQFLSHKRNLGVVRGQTPYFEPLLGSFYKEAFGIQSISHKDLLGLSEDASKTRLEAWVESLKKDTSFVLFAEDHPVTAEIYDWEKLDELLNEKKIFSIRVSHFAHHYHKAPLRPMSVQLCHLHPDLAVAMCGERFKVPPLLAPSMNWNSQKILEQIDKLHVTAEDKSAVEKFEASFATLATPWFQNPGTPRLYDRVLLNFKDVSGEALLTALEERLQIDAIQQHQTLDTTNLCRWNHYRTFGWWEPKPTEEDLQGLLVIDAGWLVTKDFSKILAQLCEEIRAQQSW